MDKIPTAEDWVELLKNYLNIETLLDFYDAFLEIIANKIISLLSNQNSPSSNGWEIYNLLNEIAKNYAIESIDGIKQNMFKLTELIFFKHKEWINWYYNILNSSKVYTCWRDELNLYLMKNLKIYLILDNRYLKNTPHIEVPYNC